MTEKTCFARIRDLRRIRNTFDHTTACIIATSLIHTILDYCKSLFLNLNCQQTRVVVSVSTSRSRDGLETYFSNVSVSSRSRTWRSRLQPCSKPTDCNLFSTLLLVLSLKPLNTIISLLTSNLPTGTKSHNAYYNEKYPLTHKSLQFKQPSSIIDLKIQPTHSTRSSAVVTLQRPSNPSRLKITDRSFYHQAPALWNSLPKHLRALSSTLPTQTNNSLLSLSSFQFHKQLKTYLSLQPNPP